MRTSKANIIKHLSGVKGSAKDLYTILDIWKLFFPLPTVQEIVSCTNIYLEKLRTERSYQRATDIHATNVNKIYTLMEQRLTYFEL